jgi:lambda repressor-like predicted transcriptional regulator
MANTKTVEDVRDLIMEKMTKEGRMLTWLSDVSGINYNTLHSCIVRKLFSLSEESLAAINKALNTDFKLN